MVARELSEDEGRRLLSRLQDAGLEIPQFWWELSSAKVDWAYALALSHHVGEPSHDEPAGAGQHNLDEELQRETMRRAMRQEVEVLKRDAACSGVTLDPVGLASMDEFVNSIGTSMTETPPFRIGGQPVGLFTLDRYNPDHGSDDPTGSSLWMSSLVLSKELERRTADLGSKTVIELGAGLGLASLMAHRLGCRHVTATDGVKVAVAMLEINVAAMHIESPEGEHWDGDVSSLPVEVVNYAYGENATPLGGPFDLVLCSDVIYLKISDETMRGMVKSCCYLTQSGSEVLMAFAIRQASFRQLDFFLELMAESGFTHSKLTLGNGIPQIAQQCVEVHSFVKR